jgi:DNA-binding CsgD family transcriptional regulator
MDHLTARQRKILNLLADGISTREVAFILDINEKVAQGLITRTLEVCNLTSRQQVKSYLAKQGAAP